MSRATLLLLLADADAHITGDSTDDGAGLTLAPAGDTDGDGLDDLLVDAHADDDGGTDAGAAYVLLGGGR